MRGRVIALLTIDDQRLRCTENLSLASRLGEAAEGQHAVQTLGEENARGGAVSQPESLVWFLV